MFKMFLDQIAMTVFGTMLSFATLKNEGLLLASSIFSYSSNLMLLYTVGWTSAREGQDTYSWWAHELFP